MRLTRNVHAERLQAALAPREWSFSTERVRHVALLLITGTAELRIADGARRVEGPSYSWLPHGASLSITLAAGASGFLMTVDDDVCASICERSADGLAVGQAARRLTLISANDVRTVLDDLVTSFAAMTREVRTLQRGANAAIAAHLELILLHGWRLVGAPPAVRQSAPGRSQTFERFAELIDRHFPEHWPISKFADTLGVTEDRLHAICTREAGQSPLALVHARLIETARTRLETSLVPVEQIAIRLGYADAGYFNRFFKKRVGVSPGAYRRRAIAQRLSERGEAFAAWP